MGLDNYATEAGIYRFLASEAAFSRRVSISFSHVTIRFQLKMLWDASIIYKAISTSELRIEMPVGIIGLKSVLRSYLHSDSQQ